MKSDFLLSLRHLLKNKGLTLVKSFGLSVGISACLLVYVITDFELSFDRFQPNRDRIYRVYTRYKSTKITRDYKGIYMGAVDQVRENLTGIAANAHFYIWPQKVTINMIPRRARVFESNNNLVFAAPDFFDVFNSYRWLEGSPGSSLGDPYKVVLTESRAKFYFGNLPMASVIGREIIYADSIPVSVAGIVADIDENTDLIFTDFISYGTADRLGTARPFSINVPDGLDNNSQLFIKLSPKADSHLVSAQLMAAGKITTSDFSLLPRLQLLSDMHFNSEIGIFDVSSRWIVKRSTINVLVAVALALMVVSIINFVNLETAQASARAKEIGIRKAMGSSRISLIRYFLLENFVLTFISIGFSIIFSWIAMRYFRELIPQGINLRLTDINVVIFLGCCMIAVPLIAGIYPALLLSSFRPLDALKQLRGSTGQGRLASFLQRGLITFQFLIAQILITISIIVGSQIRFMNDKNLGFSPDAIINLSLSGKAGGEKKYVLKQQLERIEGVSTVTLQSQPPSGGSGTNSLFLAFEGSGEPVEEWINVKYGDGNYISTYDLNLIAGHNFVDADSARGFIINETYMKKLGFKNSRDIVGKAINGQPIIGVVSDFHTESLHSSIKPFVITCNPMKMNSFGIKLFSSGRETGNLAAILNRIEQASKKIYGEKLEFYFLDERIRNLYQSEKNIEKVATSAMVLSILISCLGLFALSSFACAERTKEIGIRKVLGATTGRIVLLLSSEFLKLVFISFVASVPISYFFGSNWLESFAFKASIDPLIFIVTGVLSLTLGFITVSVRTIQSATANPVKALNYE